jgi:hypothetical protein
MPRRQSERQNAIDALLTSDVLDALRRPTTFLPPALRLQKRGRKLQVFEVLSAYLLSLVEPDFRWTVTPMQNDRGVDFRGEKRLFRLRPHDDFRMIVAGQCKASAGVKKPLTSDLWDLLDTAHPSIVYIVLMTRISPKRISDARRKFERREHLPCRILDLDSVVDLLGLQRKEVRRFIDKALVPKDAGVLLEFLDQIPAAPDIGIKVGIKAPGQTRAGSPFEIRVTAESFLLAGKTIAVRWNRGPEITVIKPAVLNTPQGFKLPPDSGFRSQFTLKVVAYHVGELDLGELVFEIDSKPVKTVPVGWVTTVDEYQPQFFWEPYESLRVDFLELLELAAGNAPQAVAVVGQGGTGKTRFCQELGYLAEQQDGYYIFVAHPQNRTQPYRIFGLLLQELLGETIDPVTPRESVESFIRSIHPTLHETARGTIAAIFSSGHQDGSAFDREAMLQMLLVALLRKGETPRMVVHLRDMHWAGVETLEVLGELLLRLKKTSADYRLPVLMVFEGRVQTNIAEANDRTAVQEASTAVFESFLTRFALKRLDVRAFTGKESRDFLDHLFENTQSVNRRVALGLIPHQKLLIGEIDRYGRGNPFHMIEQIKLLRHDKVVDRNPRTGLIFLTRRLKRQYCVPKSVHQLIRLRMQFIEKTAPDVALLVKAVGVIKDRVDATLFEELHRRLARRTPVTAVHEVELLDGAGSGSVGFRHENYYQVVHDWPLTADEQRRITKIYLDWYSVQGRGTADLLYEEALVREKQPRSDRRLITTLLTKSLEKAEASHQYQLGIYVIDKLLQDSARGRRLADLIEVLQLRSKLATFSIDVQDWALGAEQYETILEVIKQYLRDTQPAGLDARAILNYWRASALVGLANSKTDLSRSHEAVAALNEGRRICDGYFASVRIPDEKWSILHGRLLNRLGEAHWMDGNYAESLIALEAATAAVDAHPISAEETRGLHHVNLLDYGAVLLHQSPERAVEELKKSRALIPDSGWPPRYTILSSITLAIGEMVDVFVREKSATTPRLRRFLHERVVPTLLADLEQASFYGYKQEQVAASLMLGIALSLLNDSAAAGWYMESIETAFRSNNLESLWRGHLNLAQFLANSDHEAAMFHCSRACTLLLDDVRPRKSTARTWRLRHLSRPLFRIVRFLPTSDIPDALRDLLPELTPPAPVTREAIDPMFFSDKIVFFPSGGNEYYPYGG